MIIIQLLLSILLVPLFCVLVAENFAAHPLFLNQRPLLAAALGGLGALAVFLGVILARRRVNKKQPEPGMLGQFLDMRFWGVTVILCGVITFQFVAWDIAGQWAKLSARMNGGAQVVEARESADQKDAPPKPEPKKPVAPLFKIQGIILRGERSVVLVNGQSFAVGESIEDEFLVKEIFTDGVVVEQGGRTATVRLGAKEGSSKHQPPSSK